MKIIGLGHYSRTGKDTAAKSLVTNLTTLGVRAKRMSFAWKLKQITHELYGWAGLREPEFYDTLEGEPWRTKVLPDLGMTPVDIWVRFGTPAVREQVYSATWVDYVLKTNHHVDVLVIPDVRFQNEADAIRAHGGELIKVVRPGIEPKNTPADQALVGFEGWDEVIGTSGNIEELYTWARSKARNLS